MAVNHVKFLKGMMSRKISLRRGLILLMASEWEEVCNSDIIRETRGHAAVISADLKKMLTLKWIRETKAGGDQRLRKYSLTPNGRELVISLTSPE